MMKMEALRQNQTVSIDVIAKESQDAQLSITPAALQPFPSLEGWRGLAHYHTESRRNVVKKKPQDRTPSDLYILEETVKGVKLIGDLPLAKRLDICRYLRYEKWEPNLTVYEQGQVGSTFYIVFTGLVRASVHEEGVQEDGVLLMLPGDTFGELALSKEECRMTETAFTTERSELLTLTKKDYESILKIEKTPEIRERVKFLKSIAAFNEVSKQSLYRLANVLTSRKYAKNKSITFQGDEPFEMFFIRSGECRIIMEIATASKPILRLPRVSTFIYQQSKTIHHKCKAEVHERQKHWGRPSVMARLSARTSSVQAQSFPAPEEIGQAILDNPDLLRELAIGHARVAREKSEQKQPKQARSRLANTRTTSRSSRQFISMPNSAKQETTATGFKDSTGTSELSPWGGSPRAESGALPGTPLQRSIQKSEPLSFVTASPRLKTLAMEEQQHLVQDCGMKDVNHMSETGVQSARFKKKEMQERVYKRKKRKNSKPQKYTLTKFLHEVEEKEKHHREIDFSVKEHALWHMTVSQSVVKSAFSEDVKYYRSKFQAWARGVLSREKQLLGFNVYDNSQGSPSFIPGAGEGIQKLEQESGSQYKNNKKQGTMILDIGALSAGDYFGERGLLKKSRRAVSIVSVSPVEVLVLNIWDFHRHCDKDVIEALAAHDYRKEEQIYKQYLKNCRWERFKKKVLDEVFEAKAFRTYMRVGLKAMHYIPEEDGPKGPKQTLSEWK